MTIVRSIKVIGAHIVDRSVPGRKLELNTLTSDEIGTGAVATDEIGDRSITGIKILGEQLLWSHLKTAVKPYVYIGTIETAIDTGLDLVDAFFIIPWDARGVHKTRDPVGGTVYLAADTPGSIDLYAIYP